MLLVTALANDMELTACAGDCEYVAFTDEAESLGWGYPTGSDEMLCENCLTAWADDHGVTLSPSPTRYRARVLLEAVAA